MERWRVRLRVAGVIGLLASALIAVPTRAMASESVVTHTWELGFTPTNWSRSAEFPQFDPAFGNLLDVTVELESAVAASMFVENLSTSSHCDATLTWGGVVNLGGSPALVSVDLTNTVSLRLEIFDGVADFAGASGASFPDLGASGVDQIVLSDAAAMAPYIGTGTVSLGVAANATASARGCGAIEELFRTNVSTTVRVTYRYASAPAIDIEKATNGEDADEPTGPEIPVGDPVTWTYVVTNTGDVDLSNVTVVDDQGVAVTCPQDTLAVGESMTCTGNGTAEQGQYANLGTTEGEAADGTIVTDEDPSHYYGVDEPPPSEPAIDIEKATNGEDADEPTGPWIVEGDPVEWTYVVTNTGDVDLSNVTVVDDQGVAVTCPQDTLAVGESMTCTGNGTAEQGQYANLGTTEGEAADGTIVTDEDPSHYYGASRTCAAGCTSNYYGNPLHFGQWRSYGPDDAYGLVFGVDVDGSLVDMIRAPLDPSNAWAALGREAVTALLNAAHPDVPYPYTEAEIIAQVRNAYQMNEPTLARGVLKQMNQRACPLGPGNHDH